MERFYVVTFDLKNSHGRRYNYVKIHRDLKKEFGPTGFWPDPAKQMCVVAPSDEGITQSEIHDFMIENLGGDCHIWIAEVVPGSWNYPGSH